MKQNMGQTDKIIRVTAAVVIAALWYFGVISGTLALILGAIAAIFILTSLVGVCPLYLPFGLSTLRKKL